MFNSLPSIDQELRAEAGNGAWVLCSRWDAGNTEIQHITVFSAVLDYGRWRGYARIISLLKHLYRMPDLVQLVASSPFVCATPAAHIVDFS